MLPLDQPWSPLFEGASIEVLEVSGTTSLLKICWLAPAHVTAPLALPPPWSGTVLISATPGCTSARYTAHDRHLESLVLGEEDLKELEKLLTDGSISGLLPRTEVPAATTRFTTLAEARLEGKRIAREVSEGRLLILGRGEAALVPMDQNAATYFLGDPIPWAAADPDTRLRWYLDDGPASDLPGYAAFVERIGVTLPKLLHRTGRGAYAGIGVNLVVEREDRLGYLRAAERADIANALRDHVAPENLSAHQKRWREYWLDRYAGAPPLGPVAGTATLAIGPTVIDVTVSGRTVYSRDPKERIAALTADHRENFLIDIQVPVGEAVLVRTSTVGYLAGDGVWATDAVEAWSVFLPDHRYELQDTSRIGAPGPTCMQVEGLPEGATAFWQGGRLTVKPEGWPFPVEVRPTEPGTYTVVLRPDGAERVRYAAEGCS